MLDLLDSPPSSEGDTPQIGPLGYSKSSDVSVDTLYGTGILVELLAESDYAERIKVQLPYGMLYTCQEDVKEAMLEEERRKVVANARSSTSSPPPSSHSVVSGSTVSPTVAFSRVRCGIMTSMVATLDLISSSHIFFANFQQMMDFTMYEDMLRTLELVHWHARSFNEDQPMRAELRGRKFMVFTDNPLRSPNLLERSEYC